MPTAALPGVLDRFDDTPPAHRERAALRELGLRPRLTDWCAELDALGVPDSLDHADLHNGQVFHPAPGRFTFVDWGDAVVAHPFSSLAVPRRAAGTTAGEYSRACATPISDPGRTPAVRRRNCGAR
ncbi:phosphotransferase [Streptomyces ardesiacus]|uniref:phosphotransferase n=1 Tax=Streptomyces ardesiacus TaxID=285564 RepID=UPI0027E34B1B|nr:phosphotransferase [Streptomyces ardesiacus]